MIYFVQNLIEHIGDKLIFKLHLQLLNLMEFPVGRVFQRTPKVTHCSLSISLPDLGPSHKVSVPGHQRILDFGKLIARHLFHFCHHRKLADGVGVA